MHPGHVHRHRSNNTHETRLMQSCSNINYYRLTTQSSQTIKPHIAPRTESQNIIVCKVLTTA